MKVRMFLYMFCESVVTSNYSKKSGSKNILYLLKIILSHKRKMKLVKIERCELTWVDLPLCTSVSFISYFSTNKFSDFDSILLYLYFARSIKFSMSLLLCMYSESLTMVSMVVRSSCNGFDRSLEREVFDFLAKWFFVCTEYSYIVMFQFFSHLNINHQVYSLGVGF